MKALTVSWNETTDQTDVTFTAEFNAQHAVAKIDILTDALAILEMERDKTYINSTKEVTTND